MEVKEVDKVRGLQSVVGPDGVQQRVFLGTNFTSDEELSTGDSMLAGSLLKFPVMKRLFEPKHAGQDMILSKNSGPSKSSEKNKSGRSSPYNRPQRYTKGNIKEKSEGTGGGKAFKNEDQVMMEEVVGVSTLAIIPAEPNPLTGPRREAR
jgi:hypothetical protein